MALPDSVRAFWYEMCALSNRATRTPWGVVATDPRFPLVWEANMACVMEAAPELTLGEIQSALHPALRQAGAVYEHVEFWEPSRIGPALEEARARRQHGDPDVVMVRQGTVQLAPLPADVEVQEVRVPEPRFWPWYRSSLAQFGMRLSETVLDQMMERTRSVSMPAGMRWFVATIDGEPAGYTSLISLAGVGYLDGVVTMPGFRSRGVATATILRAVEASGRAGDAEVFLLTDPAGNARPLYERLGFRVAAQVEGCTRLLDAAEDPA
jgi:GNAT superfamily N-acetyltransferase